MIISAPGLRIFDTVASVCFASGKESSEGSALLFIDDRLEMVVDCVVLDTAVDRLCVSLLTLAS